MFVLIPEIENECQVVNNVLINHSLSLDKEHYNIISKSFDNDCYFHSIAILLDLSTDQFKDLLLAYVTNISNADTISRLLNNSHSLLDTVLRRLSIGGNTSGIYCELYNELVLKVFLVDIHTHYISIHHHGAMYSHSQNVSSPSSSRVINLLLLHDLIVNQASFFPLRNI